MTDNRKYLPGERSLYEKLTLEEKQEWDSLSEEDKRFNLELTGQKGEELYQKLKGTSERIDRLNKRLIKLHNLKKINVKALNDLEEEIDSFNYRFNIFDF